MNIYSSGPKKFHNLNLFLIIELTMGGFLAIDK